MKLLGYIELTLSWCNVIFSTSVSDFRPEVGQFFENRKFQSLKPEVDKYLIGKLVSFCNESPIFVFWFLNPGGHQNHFCPGMSIYSYIESKNFQKLLAPLMFKIPPNWHCTYDLEFDSLSFWNIFDFRFRKFQLPVHENSSLPVWGWKRKSKIWRCIMTGSTLYAPKVSSKSVHGCPRSYSPHLKWPPS